MTPASGISFRSFATRLTSKLVLKKSLLFKKTLKNTYRHRSSRGNGEQKESRKQEIGIISRSQDYVTRILVLFFSQKKTRTAKKRKESWAAAAVVSDSSRDRVGRVVIRETIARNNGPYTVPPVLSFFTDSKKSRSARTHDLFFLSFVVGIFLSWLFFFFSRLIKPLDGWKFKIPAKEQHSVRQKRLKGGGGKDAALCHSQVPLALSMRGHLSFHMRNDGGGEFDLARAAAASRVGGCFR